MLLALPQLPDAWDSIRGVATLPQLPVAASGATAGPVLLFVSGDVDSVATARTLTFLLKADLVRYEVHPVAGYAHLAEIYSTLTTGESACAPRAILCINCGGAVDLSALLGLDDTPETPVFVLDCHRPFHLRNLSANNIILIDDDENTDDSAFPMDLGVEDMYGNVSDHDFSDSDNSSDDDDDSESSDEDSDGDDESGGGDENEYSESDRSVDTDIEDIIAEDSDADSDAIDDLVANNGKKKNNNNASTEFKSSILGETANETDSTTPSTGSKRTRTPESGETSTRRRSTKRRRSGRRNEQTSKPGGAPKSKSRAPRRRKKMASGGNTTGKSRRKRDRRRRRAINVTPAERTRIQEYYGKTSIGMSSACLSHNLAHTLRRDNLDTLWLAIVGVTSHYLSSNITEDLYNDAVVYFREQLAQLIPANVTDENGVETSTLENVGYSTSTSKDLRVRNVAPSLELRLDLIRHWTLFESLLNSSYTVTRLAAWKQTGKRRLQELLATLGIPLRESKQAWCFMNSDCKDALDGRLPSIVKRFDLGAGIQYESFVRALPGHRGAVCAADVSLCVAALLETTTIGTGNSNSNSDKDGNGKNGVEAKEFLGLQQRFWSAYDALGANANLSQGLDLAIESQALVAGIVSDVIERKKYVPSGAFRYVFLRDVPNTHSVVLARPLVLRRVALFLIQALAKKGAKHKPFVVLAPDAARNTWLAVAASPIGGSRMNDFGARFQRAADRNKSNVAYAGFDSAVVEIQDGQEVEFVRYIHDVLR